MAALDTNVTTLQTAALDKIVKNLGELAKSIASRFCCGGTLTSPDQVKLVYENGGIGWSSATFPGAEEMAVQRLLDVCSVASFGVGSEEVTDRSYRDAFQLDPKRFMTSFQLCDTPILGEIQKLMMPDVCSSIRAELYKLNVYTGPGGHFKVHVDTPRSNQMFGSLVVCLPSQFTGGALVTRHQGQEVRFDWSSSPQSPMQKVSWAAFFSDVEHEVLPVSDGYRFTLTYNLYCVHKQDVMPTISITPSPFCRELRAAVNNPHFMRDGGVLGFSCHHEYVFQDLNCTEDLPCLLKGADNIVYVAAKSLGLLVIVKPVTDSNAYITDRYVLPKFAEFLSEDYYCDFECEDNAGDQMIAGLYGRVFLDKSITWCQELDHFQPAATYIAYGNEPSSLALYHAAAILVGVPKWDKRQALEMQHSTCDSETLEPSSKKPKKNGDDTYGGPDMEELLECD